MSGIRDWIAGLEALGAYEGCAAGEIGASSRQLLDNFFWRFAPQKVYIGSARKWLAGIVASAWCKESILQRLGDSMNSGNITCVSILQNTTQNHASLLDVRSSFP